MEETDQDHSPAVDYRQTEQQPLESSQGGHRGQQQRAGGDEQRSLSHESDIHRYVEGRVDDSAGVAVPRDRVA